jgi:cytochrome c553
MPFRTRVALALTVVLTFGLAVVLPGPTACAAAPPPDTIDARLLACTGCHGDQGRATADGYYPRIAGKPAGYLANQLLNFRDGRRAVPSMTWMVGHLSDDYLREIAAHFASRHPPYPAPPPPAVSPEVLERGRRLVVAGDASRELPACSADRDSVQSLGERRCDFVRRGRRPGNGVERLGERCCELCCSRDARTDGIEGDRE